MVETVDLTVITILFNRMNWHCSFIKDTNRIEMDNVIIRIGKDLYVDWSTWPILEMGLLDFYDKLFPVF